MRKLLLSCLLILTVTILQGCKLSENSEVIITLNSGIDTVEINTTHTDAGASATVGEETLTVSVLSNNVDMTQKGSYQIVYKATYEEQDYFVTRYVYVVDETTPIILLNEGTDTIFVGDDWVDSGVTVTDNSLETLSYVVSGTVNNQLVGAYTITYTSTDSSNNSVSIVRIVNVVN